MDLRPARVERLLGDGVPADEMARLLTSVGFAVKPGADGHLHVTPPTWRHDVWRDVDLVEEIARLRGYDVLSDRVSPFRPGTVPDNHAARDGERVRDALVGDGLPEVRPLPFVRGDDATHVRVANPLADDEPHLRRSLLETLARRAEYNLTRMQGDVRLFEIGSAFTPRPDGLPLEAVRVGALIMGARVRRISPSQSRPRSTPGTRRRSARGSRRVAFPAEAATLEPAEDGRSG